MPPTFEPNKPVDHGNPHHDLGHKPKDQEPKLTKPVDKPQDEKTAGDLRKEDADAAAEDVTAQKQGVQDEADVVAMEQYKKEQLDEFPPDSDPLKDREARRAEDKKHDHGAAQEAKDKAAQKPMRDERYYKP